MSGWRAVSVAVVLGLVAAVMPTAAWAGSPEDPDLTDPCGPQEELGADLLPEPAAPWTDVCSAWFETVSGDSGPPAVKVSLALAGDITERPAPAAYYVSWRVNDCLYAVEHGDAGTLPGEIRELRYRCGPAYEPVPCDPPQPVMPCSEPTPVERIPLPDGVFSWEGNVLSVTLVFDHGLAGHAADYAPGSVLERLYGRASGPAAAGTACFGTDCGSLGADTASGGRAYTMEGGAGPAPEVPAVPGVASCVSGSVDSASAAQPHVTDPEGDTGHVMGYPYVDGPGWDLRALWFTRAQDGVNLHLLPAGPATAATTAYAVHLDGQIVRVEGQPDGTWQASVYEDTETPNLDYPGTATEVTVDATTGEAVVALPQALLPAGDVLRPDRFFSYYIVGGEAPRAGPGRTTMLSVDDNRGAHVCDAHLH